MQKVSDKIYRFSLTSVKLICLFLTGILFFSGFLSTAYTTDMDTQTVLIEWRNPLFTVMGSLMILAIFAGILFFIRKLSRGNWTTTQRILRFLVLGWCMCAGIILLIWGRSAPAGDAYSVYSLARNLALGNTSVIHPTESYISYYPQQIGLIAFWEMIMRVVNLLPTDLHAYHFIKLLYCVLACVIVFFQEKIVHILWRNPKIDCLYLILAATNVPLLMYTSFIYGEIPSYAATTIGIYLLFRMFSNRKVSSAIGCLFFLALSVMLRKNSLIFIIAIVLVTLLWALYQKRAGLLCFCVACVVSATTVLPFVEQIYEYRSGNEIQSGVTATSYFAMGMQEAPRSSGWYNAFNYNTYQQSGMNPDIANEISRRAITERLAYFKENPAYAASFYLEKYLSQWVDGSYACRQASLAVEGGRNNFFHELYSGKYSKYLIVYCDFYQNIMYLGAFLFCLAGIKKTPKAEEAFRLPAYLGLIAVIGGYLFHMLWEANARYIFPYALSMLPYSAFGLKLLASRLYHALKPSDN